MKEIDHEYTDTVICPYCGHDNGNDEMNDTRGSTIQCGNEDCEKYFSYEPTYSVTYSTFKAPCENGEPHVFSPPYYPWKDNKKGFIYCRHCSKQEPVGDWGAA